jgi:hypothetical protein
MSLFFDEAAEKIGPNFSIGSFLIGAQLPNRAQFFNRAQLLNGVQLFYGTNISMGPNSSTGPNSAWGPTSHRYQLVMEPGPYGIGYPRG